jgi:hypothetical protein
VDSLLLSQNPNILGVREKKPQKVVDWPESRWQYRQLKLKETQTITFCGGAVHDDERHPLGLVSGGFAALLH